MGLTIVVDSDALDVIPEQSATGLATDAGNVPQLLTVVAPELVEGAVTGNSVVGEKCQIVETGVGDVIAQDIAKYIP
ncbi:hypothetical protein CJF32_00006488 [Rutstroemia sp. NJR-2017a WRK4]|nr:hypothetical protein CJF32_00006488 [Rutstroemia sp. NJR-2017a WRK4]